jgi:hypothetical protein
MSHREAIRILMLSPFYWQLPPINRWELIKGYCADFESYQK